MAKFYYAVKNGRNPGIYNTWSECEQEVKGFENARYKKFKSYEEARDFIEGDNNQTMNLMEVNSKENSLLDIENIKEDEVIAYVDGSFSLDEKAYSYGMVIFTDRGKETFSGKSDDVDLAEMRNVAGELRGAMEAMKYSISRGKSTLYLHYDYMGIEEWARGSWKTNKAGTKAYKNYYDSIKDSLKVVFIKVLAHSGIEFNEEADKLAKKELS
ncbi:MAG TPA: ribonuclease H family protein [Tissierellaceae bacterium]|nr:ribonuclease H family protein [Tissierellaceae bacterium]